MSDDSSRFAPHPGTTPEQSRIKRFYVDAGVDRRPNGFAVVLDGRPIRTPAGRELVLSSEALVRSLAAEWQAQGTTIDPATMPLTRIVNSALDGVSGREREVRADIVSYASSDLLCYMADSPQDLAERQAERWGAIHDWARETHGINLTLAAGVMPVVQDRAMLQRIAGLIEAHDALVLAGLHTMTTLTGSALLAIATAEGQVSTEHAWELAHIDEDYQIEQWGEDHEAAVRRAGRWAEMNAAAHIVSIGKKR